MGVSDLERSAIQVLAAETGATDVKTYPELDYCVLVDDAHGARVHIHHSYPQWVMARVGRGSSTKKRLDPESVRVAIRRAKKIDERSRKLPPSFAKAGGSSWSMALPATPSG